MECIVLAGGLGTRLQGVIGPQPKCMAPVNDRPFLHYLFDYIATQPIDRVILSLGFKSELVLDGLNNEQRPFRIDHVIEHEPLGTGGGIQLALNVAETDDVIVLNGDTMFQVDIANQYSFHQQTSAATTLALKHLENFDRYGMVNIDAENVIISFEEKRHAEQGLINGGVYIINKPAFMRKNLPEKFSFEKDYLEAFVEERKFAGYRSDAYFIDIGIPADYQQAQHDFKTLFK